MREKCLSPVEGAQQAIGEIKEGETPKQLLTAGVAELKCGKEKEENYLCSSTVPAGISSR